MMLTLHDTGNVDLTNIAVSFSSTRFSQAAGGTCGTTLVANVAGTTSCTINSSDRGS